MDKLIEDMFSRFTKKGLVLYRFTIVPSYGKLWRKPVIVDGVQALNEPVAVRVTKGWESRYEENYPAFEVGEIKKMEPLPTLKDIIEAGPEYLREFLGVMVDRLVDEQFSR